MFEEMDASDSVIKTLTNNFLELQKFLQENKEEVKELTERFLTFLNDAVKVTAKTLVFLANNFELVTGAAKVFLALFVARKINNMVLGIVAMGKAIKGVGLAASTATPLVTALAFAIDLFVGAKEREAKFLDKQNKVLLKQTVEDTRIRMNALESLRGAIIGVTRAEDAARGTQGGAFAEKFSDLTRARKELSSQARELSKKTGLPLTFFINLKTERDLDLQMRGLAQQLHKNIKATLANAEESKKLSNFNQKIATAATPAKTFADLVNKQAEKALQDKLKADREREDREKRAATINRKAMIKDFTDQIGKNIARQFKLSLTGISGSSLAQGTQQSRLTAGEFTSEFINEFSPFLKEGPFKVASDVLIGGFFSINKESQDFLQNLSAFNSTLTGITGIVPSGAGQGPISSGPALAIDSLGGSVTNSLIDALREAREKAFEDATLQVDVILGEASKEKFKEDVKGLSENTRTILQGSLSVLEDAATAAFRVMSNLSEKRHSDDLTKLEERKRALSAEKQHAFEAFGKDKEKRALIEAKFLEKEKELELQKLAIEKDAAKERKRMALIQVAINTAIGVTNAIAFGTTITSRVIGAAVAVAAGISQAAVISSQNLRNGGIVGGRGNGTSDSNLVSLSRGENVTSVDTVNRLGGQDAFNQLIDENIDSGLQGRGGKAVFIIEGNVLGNEEFIRDMANALELEDNRRFN